MVSIVEKAAYRFQTLAQEQWDKKVADVATESSRVVKQRRNEGHEFEPAILGPREILGRDDRPVQLGAVVLELDWKLAKKRQMVELARDFIDAAYLLNESYDSSLPGVLAATIEERGLFEYGVGEFFLLYGRFEQKYRTYKGQMQRTR